MKKGRANCPAGHGPLGFETITKNMTFRGVDIEFQVESYVCAECNLEVGTIEQGSNTQKAISDAYRKKVGLLTSEEIKEGRKEIGLTQRSLARKINVGIASIKRWEGGMIQSKSMNSALKIALRGQWVGNNYTGNRALSIPRIKQVIKEFERELGEEFLRENEKMLFDAKYLWYADMLAFREFGRSITGATYAALPYGPQLNNYRDLLPSIKDADEKDAEPLSAEEKRIIARVAKTFPQKRMIIDAAHKETIWKRKSPGMIIAYTDSEELLEI